MVVFTLLMVASIIFGIDLASKPLSDKTIVSNEEYGIQMEFSGKKSAAYVKGINNLYEFDKGANSGWLYFVNGVRPVKSCGAYVVENGDVIEWKYV